MIITIFANYGTLTKEKQVVYSTVPIEGAVSERIRVEIPWMINTKVNLYGERLVAWNDDYHLLSDVLESDSNGNPCIVLPTKYAVVGCRLNVLNNREEDERW